MKSKIQDTILLRTIRSWVSELPDAELLARLGIHAVIADAWLDQVRTQGIAHGPISPRGGPTRGNSGT